MMRLPPRASFLKSFTKGENVGDVSAKANAQDVLSGLIGMIAGILCVCGVRGGGGRAGGRRH